MPQLLQLEVRDKCPTEKKRLKQERCTANEDPDECERWLREDLGNYQDLVAANNGRAPKQKNEASVSTTAAARATIVGDVLWPADAYEETFSNKPTPGMLATRVLEDGSSHTGAIRPDKIISLIFICFCVVNY